MKNRDNLHFSWSKQLSYNKVWNFAVLEREGGKSTDAWLKIWKAWRYQSRPSIVFRRQTVDITVTFIEDIESLLNKFLDKPVQLVYNSSDFPKGIADIKMGEAGVTYTPATKKNLPIFIRIHSLSSPLNRIKSLFLKDVKYMFMDEFIVNPRLGEKYAKDEVFKIKEIYNTYNREARTPIKCMFAGNPYTVFSPYWSDEGIDIDVSKLKPGAFIIGKGATVNCWQLTPELRALILKHNPLYKFDNSYTRYAFNGENMLDKDLLIVKQQPRNFGLKVVVKMSNTQYLALYHANSSDYKGPYTWWVAVRNKAWADTLGKRTILAFDFSNLQLNGRVALKGEYMWMDVFSFKMRERKVAYATAEAAYLSEDLYNFI